MKRRTYCTRIQLSGGRRQIGFCWESPQTEDPDRTTWVNVVFKMTYITRQNAAAVHYRHRSRRVLEIFALIINHLCPITIINEASIMWNNIVWCRGAISPLTVATESRGENFRVFGRKQQQPTTWRNMSSFKHFPCCLLCCLPEDRFSKKFRLKEFAVFYFPNCMVFE